MGGWDINSAFVFLYKRESLASPWAELEGRGRRMCFHPHVRVWELLCTALKGTLRMFAEASPEFRNKPKVSAASDKVLITLVQRMC